MAATKTAGSTDHFSLNFLFVKSARKVENRSILLQVKKSDIYVIGPVLKFDLQFWMLLFCFLPRTLCKLDWNWWVQFILFQSVDLLLIVSNRHQCWNIRNKNNVPISLLFKYKYLRWKRAVFSIDYFGKIWQLYASKG